MTLRTAAEAAHILCCSEDREVAGLGLSMLAELAEKRCYCAVLSLVYFYDRGGAAVSQNRMEARRWVERAHAMHPHLMEAEDLYDAGMKCMWDELFSSTREDAIELWDRAARAGSAEALFAICDATRSDPRRSGDWIAMLESAARQGSMRAMVELSEQPHVRGTHMELVWLRAAVVLGSLRAKEILGLDMQGTSVGSNNLH